MRPSATSAPAKQADELAAAPMRVVRGSVVGYQLRPRKRARVKRELTLTTLSKAIMWMLVLVRDRRETSDMFPGLAAVAERGEDWEERRENILIILWKRISWFAFGFGLCVGDSKLGIPCCVGSPAITSRLLQLPRFSRKGKLESVAEARKGSVYEMKS